MHSYQGLQILAGCRGALVAPHSPLWTECGGQEQLPRRSPIASKLGTSKTLKEAFDPPYRGKPLESFSIRERGLKGLVEQVPGAVNPNSASGGGRTAPAPTVGD
jgi:hypothetical protein